MGGNSFRAERSRAKRVEGSRTGISDNRPGSLQLQIQWGTPAMPSEALDRIAKCGSRVASAPGVPEWTRRAGKYQARFLRWLRFFKRFSARSRSRSSTA